MQKVTSKALWGPRGILIAFIAPIVVFGLCFSMGPPSCQKGGIVLASFAALVPFLIPFIISFFYPVAAGCILILEIAIPILWFVVHNIHDLASIRFYRNLTSVEILIYLSILLGGFLYSCIGIWMIKIFYREVKKLPEKIAL